MAEKAGEAELKFIFFFLARNIDNFELNHLMYFIFTRRKTDSSKKTTILSRI